MLINKENTREKKWLIKATDTPDSLATISKIASELRLNPILAKLLYTRGYTTPEACVSFLKMEREMLLSPFDIVDMEKGVERIRRAIRDGEKITVYGDYDVDGVTSVCTLYLYLRSLGADVEYYIPNRAGEGYGVSNPAISAIAEAGTKLIITVDTGITANEEVEFAKTLGVDFLITDHHECHADLPLATAVINPHRPDCTYPFKELAGVGVVFKLICAYEERAKGLDRYTATLNIIEEYADLVAIGTIADVMPIKEENRVIVKYGLSMIENTERVGLAALIDASMSKNDKRAEKNARYSQKRKRTKITTGFIGFTLAPRINAAGRVRTATIAVELFLSEDYQSARRIAEELCNANKERQAEENKIMQEAFNKIESLDIKNNPVIVLDADDWHHGVIGIVSSRLTEKYCRPSILVSFEGNDAEHTEGEAVGKGSGRSIKGLNLVDALCACSDYLVKFGGHELAAGLSVTRENLPAFIEKINEYARENLSEKDMVPTIETDCEIAFSDIHLALAESLQLLEPYGVGNPIPMFVCRGVNLADISGISDGKHTRFTFGNTNKTVSGMYFSNSPDSLGLYVGDKVDILFSLDINEWQDRKSVQLIVRDIKISASQESENEIQQRRFEQIKGGAIFSPSENVLPSRDDMARVYRFVQNMLHSGIDTISHRDICSKLSTTIGNEMSYIKLKFIILIFKEMDIVKIEEADEVYTFTLHYSTTKRNLEKSSILKRLRAQMRE